MTRYIVGKRATGQHPISNLQIIISPPVFMDSRGNQPAYATWHASHYAFKASRGVLVEWKSGGQPVVARIFPEEAAEQLALHDAAIAQAEQRLKDARGERQEFIDGLIVRAKPVRVAEARAEREAFNAQRAAQKAAGK
jgi:hypothetical protein